LLSPLRTHRTDRRHRPKNEKAFPLLELPAELRNAVYEYALHGHLWVAVPWDSYGKDSKSYSDALALLSVCHQIHAETKLLPYVLNTFCIGDFSWTFMEIFDFFDRRSAAELQAIQSLYFTVDQHSPGVIELWDLDIFPQLRTLQIDHDGRQSVVSIKGNEIEVVGRPYTMKGEVRGW
jgi:hypothetical protein